MGNRAGTSDPEPVEVKPQAEPSRSLAERALRWISGADRKEAEAQAQAQAERDRAAALARAEAEATAQAERDRQAERAQAEAAALAQARDQAESVRVAAASNEPLIHVATTTGGTFHVRREDWLAARATRARDVPLCNWQGDPVQTAPGERTRTTLRLSTIEAAMLRPTAILTAAAYLDPEQSQDSPSLSM